MKDYREKVSNLEIEWISLSDLNKGHNNPEILKPQYKNSLEILSNNPGNIYLKIHGVENSIVIEKGVKCYGEDVFIECGSNSKIIIGENTCFNGGIIDVSFGEMIIGANCLMSYNVYIRNHDGHHIFSKKTGERINVPGNINIGEHVWIG